MKIPLTKPPFFESVYHFVIAITIFVLIYTFIGRPHQIDGESMLPALKHGDYVISERLSIYRHKLQRGDIVVFHANDGSKKDYIKRIIALGNDEIKIASGKVYVNGELEKTPFISFTQPGDWLKSEQTIFVQPNHFVVMGDNRDLSFDSREIGEISEDWLVGKVFFRYWPLISFGSVKGN